jgi:putative transposase
MAQELEKILKQVAKKNDIEIISLSIQPDHIHLFVSAPPRFSPAEMVNLFKGYSSKKLREKFPHLKKLHPRSLWVRSYYVGTAGHVSQEIIKRYIEEAQDL